MKALFITFLLLGAFSCTSEPGPQPEMVVQEPEPPRQEAPAAPIVEEGTNFDLTSITQEEFNSTKEEMQALIEEINQVIRAVVQEPELPRQEAPAAPIVEEETNFDLTSITQEEFNSTKEEMQALIEEINQVIRAKDYNKWLSYLAEDFIGVINSQNYLIELSQTSEGLKSRNIVLKTPEDYFTHVVVPSRGNVRVDPRLDDIEFLSHNRVKAFTINARKQRLRLFEFVRIGNNWKIAWPSSPVTDETSGVS